MKRAGLHERQFVVRVVLISRGQDPAKDEKPFGQVRRQPQFAGRGET